MFVSRKENKKLDSHLTICEPIIFHSTGIQIKMNEYTQVLISRIHRAALRSQRSRKKNIQKSEWDEKGTMKQQMKSNLLIPN